MYYSFNAKRIETRNVFACSATFLNDWNKLRKKFKNDKAGFADELRKSLAYAYMSKCEYEVIVSEWPPRDPSIGIKIDIYQQVMMNWDKFLEYCWENK